MVEIGKHISELLFDHDCVIVPSLGGFLASNQPSRILPNHIIYPPYRRIAFNVYLKENDGLLANYLVKSENLSYTEATRQIESFTSGCLETFENGRKVNIEEVGLLFYDKEKNIQFEALRNSNHLKESFGMESVHFLPIQRDEKKEKKKLPQEKPMRLSIPQENKRPKFIITNGKQIIGAVVIFSAIAWFSLNLYFISPKKYESTSLNPFDSQITKISPLDSIRNNPENNISKENTETLAAAPVTSEPVASNEENTNSSVTTTENENVKNEVAGANSEKNIETKTPVQPPPVNENNKPVLTNKHFLIAGVFKIKENAQFKLLQLQKLGFKNARIIEANKCSYVSIDEFSDPGDAMAFADSLHSKNLEGWIWKH